jgi:hypothetical protein
MAYPFELPSIYKIVDATGGPITTNAAITGKYISVKNAHRIWLVMQFISPGAGFASTIIPIKCTSIAGAGPTALTSVYPIWSNLATGTNDTLVVRTPAVSYAITAVQTPIVVVMEFDPEAEFNDTGYNTLSFTMATSSQATNYCCGLWFIATRFPQATPPTAVA